MICGSDIEAFLSKSDIPPDARFYPCEKCVDRSEVFVISRDTGDYTWIARRLFEGIFKRVPQDNVAILSGTVYQKLLSVVEKAKNH